ncbi:flavodoxin domain-containing protein [Cerasicoccus maritimus]|uniref:flavodoxin domain-containing protein n=1 Tax=Cerasicoccus maritimus TaxID=490089 RepID=UPI002852A8F5|nr:flavodoxin domain-containing protein [Cerasicoccus maritimus]
MITSPDENTTHIIYGTVTGNAQDLAERFSDECDARSVKHTLNAAEDWELSRFAEVKRVVLIFSTWGDGEPPDDAIEFCEALYEQKVPVNHLEYYVVALGDSAYDDFCGCGRRLDDALKQGGAKPLADRVELDVDFDDGFDAWVARFFEANHPVGQDA